VRGEQKIQKFLTVQRMIAAFSDIEDDMRYWSFKAKAVLP
jgi:hypothetical protein